MKKYIPEAVAMSDADLAALQLQTSSSAIAFASPSPRAKVPWPPPEIPPHFPLTPYRHGFCKTINGRWRHVAGKVLPALALLTFEEKCRSGFFVGARLTPPRPYVGFPMFAHANGCWRRTIGVVPKSFGPWQPATDVDGYRESWKAALKNYQRYQEALARGEHVDAQPRMLTLKALVDRYLAARNIDVERGDLKERTFVEIRTALEAYRDGVGADLSIATLEADPRSLRRHLDALREKYGWSAYNRAMRYLSTMWRWAVKPTSMALDPRAFHWFELHSCRPIRERRQQLQEDRARGATKFFDVDEIRALIRHANPPLRAAILLGIFAAYGNQDVAELPRTALTVYEREQSIRFGGRAEVIPAGWGRLHFPRPKTMLDRHAIVPDFVVAALQAVDAAMPRRPDTAHLMFRTESGAPMRSERTTRDGRGLPFRFFRTDRVAERFKRLIDRLGTCAAHGIIAEALDVGGRGQRVALMKCPTCGEPLMPMRRRGFYSLRHVAVSFAASSGAGSDTRSIFEGHAGGNVRSEYYIEARQVADLAMITRELIARLDLSAADLAPAVDRSTVAQGGAR